MPAAVNYLKKFAKPGLLLLFAGCCMAQNAPKTQPVPSKATASKSLLEGKYQASPKEEEAVPKASANAMFPAIVAIVNGKPIAGKDLESLVRRELASIGSPEWKNLREDYREQLIRSGLNQLINDKLIYEEALAGGLKVTGEEVQAEIGKISKSYKSDAEMNRALAERMLDRASLEKSLYQSLTIARFLDANISKKAAVSPEEVSAYYKEHTAEFQHPDIARTSHILIRAGETAEQDAIVRKQVESVLARAKKGEDFAKLAREFSIDSSASRGGDIGYNTKDQLVPEYGEAAFSIPVGGVQLIQSESGYHIIKVTDRKKEGLYTLNEVDDGIARRLRSQKLQAEYTKLVNRLRDQGVVEILLPAGRAAK